MHVSTSLLLWLGGGSPASAQSVVDGHVTVMLDHLPHAGEAVELRARVFVERTVEVGRFAFRFSGHVDGLIGDRGGVRRAALARPLDLYADVRFARGDIRVGLARVVWGRLDEVQPGDVVNPLDVSRFLFEGRSEARLPVALARARLFLPRDATLEALVVPVFRAGRFDQLDEPSSPFNLTVAGIPALLASFPPVRIVREAPPVTWRHLQGGVRLAATTRRVDWSVSAYRGFETFPLYRLATPLVAPPIGLPGAAAAVSLRETFPRTTMAAADVETVRGQWGLRGELAVFVEDSFQSATEPRVLAGRSFEAGLGVDRKAGDYRVLGNVLVQHRSPRAVRGSTDTSLVAGAERSFGRETRRLQLFAVYNTRDRTAFLRQMAAASVRDNVWVEGSMGWFFGRGDSSFGRFSDRDFLYARLKVFF